jgi:hypothetical protein
VRRARLVAGTVGALLLVSCGVSTEGDPVTVDDRRVPFELLAPTTTPTATTAPTASGVEATLCYHRGASVVMLTRRVPDDNLRTVLAAYLAGPTAEERALGISTAVFDASFVPRARVRGGVATVDLAPGFSDAAGPTQLEIIVELVCTLTARPGVGQVRFRSGGQPIEVPRRDGSLTAGPVSRDDYAGIIR